MGFCKFTNILKNKNIKVINTNHKDVPYFAVNVPVDECGDCGYSGEMNDICPICGGHHVGHLRRVTGYLTGSYKDSFNDGKKQEVELRVKHKGELE